MARKRATMRGTSTIGTHAPTANLVTATMTSTAHLAAAPTLLTTMPRRQPRCCTLRWRTTIAAWLTREGGEHADGVEGDERVGDAAEGDDQRGRGQPQEDHAV